MGTCLSLITNVKLNGTETESDWESIVKKLKALNLERVWASKPGHTYQETGDWSYSIIEPCDINDYYSVEFDGPFPFAINLYNHIAEIFTIYRYHFLYAIGHSDYLHTYRKNLYAIVSIIGGTEGIYLSDNSVDKLTRFQDFALFENNSYETVKAAMIAELGEPVRDYSKLNSDNLDYKNITEFFLDDFKDLKIN